MKVPRPSIFYIETMHFDSEALVESSMNMHD